AKISFLYGLAKTRPIVPRAGKRGRSAATPSAVSSQLQRKHLINLQTNFYDSNIYATFAKISNQTITHSTYT
ncbi:MAG: hypothetical protein ACOCNQ_05245, partial [Bacteroidales bacterium]